MKRVLIIEDDRDIVELVRYNLANEGFQVTAAFDGTGGLSALRKAPPDLLLLDLMLPKMSGLDICREIRKDESLNRLPVLMLTARGDEADRVVGLEMGADDYVTKPFSAPELLARLRAALRRDLRGAAPAAMLQFGALRVDLARREAQGAEGEVHLTPLEYRVLASLARHLGSIVMQRQLIREVWGPERQDDSRSLRVCIKNLRAKLEPDPRQPRYLVTETGLGYRLRADNDPPPEAVAQGGVG